VSRLVFSSAARLDRQSITAYTIENFGVEHARRLRQRFEAALNALADSPLVGRTCEALDPLGHAFRYFVVAKLFIVVYEPIENGIRVARILHGARNLAAELEHDSGDGE